MSHAAVSTNRLKTDLEPIVALALATAVLFFLGSGAIGYFNLRSLRENNARIVHTHEVIVGLSKLLSSIQDAETGQRGFVLTGNERYLDPYQEALTSIRQRIVEIADLTKDNSNQQRRLPMLTRHVDSKLAELKETIDIRRSQGLEPALALVNSDRGKIEMDALRSELNAMSQEESNLRAQRLAEMEDSYKTALLSSLLAAILGILLTVAIGILVRRATIARRHDEWLRNGHLGLATAMMGDQPTDQLGNSILEFMSAYAGAIAGAIFVGDKDWFRRASTCGVPAEASVPARFGGREGLLGQAAAERRTVRVDDVPDGYLAFGSSLGRAKPRHLVISPSIVDDTVNTVMELGFLRQVPEHVMTFLDQASTSIATAMRSASYRSELQTLLEETQRQSEELQVQSEELRVSNEELEE